MLFCVEESCWTLGSTSGYEISSSSFQGSVTVSSRCVVCVFVTEISKSLFCFPFSSPSARNHIDSLIRFTVLAFRQRENFPIPFSYCAKDLISVSVAAKAIFDSVIRLETLTHDSALERRGINNKMCPFWKCLQQLNKTSDTITEWESKVFFPSTP